MRGETMKDKSKKSTYSTTFGVDPIFPAGLRVSVYGGGQPALRRPPRAGVGVAACVFRRWNSSLRDAAQRRAEPPLKFPARRMAEGANSPFARRRRAPRGKHPDESGKRAGFLRFRRSAENPPPAARGPSPRAARRRRVPRSFRIPEQTQSRAKTAWAE